MVLPGVTRCAHLRAEVIEQQLVEQNLGFGRKLSLQK
jgi:hypothetical protein